MGTGEDPDLARDLAQLIGAPSIDPESGGEDTRAEVLAVKVVDQGGHLFGEGIRFLLGRVRRDDRCDRPLLQLLHQVVTSPLPRELGETGKVVPHKLPDTGPQRLILLDGRDLLLHWVHPGDESLLQPDQLLDRLVGEIDRLDDLLLGELVHLPLHHRYGVLRPRDGDLDSALLLGDGVWIYDQPAVNPPDLHPGDRPLERSIGDHQRRGGPEHSDDARGTIRLGRQNGGYNLYFVVVPFGKQRPDRPVDHARAQDGDVTRPPFAFEESPRDLSACVEPLFVVDAEGKIVEFFFALLDDSRH